MDGVACFVGELIERVEPAVIVIRRDARDGRPPLAVEDPADAYRIRIRDGRLARSRVDVEEHTERLRIRAEIDEEASIEWCQGITRDRGIQRAARARLAMTVVPGLDRFAALIREPPGIEELEQPCFETWHVGVQRLRGFVNR